MKATFKDWIITALAYVAICALFYAFNQEEVNDPARLARHTHASRGHGKSTHASGAAPAASVNVVMNTATDTATSTAATTTSTASISPFGSDAERAHLRQLTQEATQMTGMTASLP